MYLVKPSNIAQQYARLMSDEERDAYAIRVEDANKRAAEVRAQWAKGERARMLERKVCALESQAFALQRIASALEGYNLSHLQDVLDQLEDQQELFASDIRS